MYECTPPYAAQYSRKEHALHMLLICGMKIPASRALMNRSYQETIICGVNRSRLTVSISPLRAIQYPPYRMSTSGQVSVTQYR